jgi:hypothetical protein
MQFVFKSSLITMVWGVVVFLYLSMIMLSAIPEFLLGTIDFEGYFVGRTIDRVISTSPLLLLLIPITIINVFVVIFKTFAQLVKRIAVLSVIGFIALIPIVYTPCKDLCLLQGFAFLSELGLVFIIATILPIAWSRSRVDYDSIQTLVRETVRPALITLLYISLLVVMGIYPLRFMG